MHPLKPYFLGAGDAAAPRLTTLPEVLPHGRHRQRRHHHAAPDVLRDARQLLDRRLLQAARRSSSRGSSRSRASGSSPSEHLGHGLRGRRRSSASAPTRRRSRRGWRSACRASGSSRCPRSENFWQAGPDRAVRPVLGALPRPRARVRRARRPPGRRRTSASWSTGTSCSCSTTRSPVGRADAAAGARTSTPAWASTAWRRSCRARTSVFETDQFRAADRARRGARGHAATARTFADRPRAADPRRPHARR